MLVRCPWLERNQCLEINKNKCKLILSVVYRDNDGKSDQNSSSIYTSEQQISLKCRKKKICSTLLYNSIPGSEVNSANNGLTRIQNMISNDKMTNMTSLV